jgi:hypothetical protein
VFVQIIEGKVTDAEGLRRQLDRWDSELKPSAEGFVGSTSGLTDDGGFFAAARFESEEAARRNSDSPQQSAWWNETEKCLSDVSFTDFGDSETALFMGGGSDDAGFVQAMVGTTSDVAKLMELDNRGQEMIRDQRPDIIGGVNCWKSDGRFVAINYFTSEAEARVGEKKEMPPEATEAINEWQSVITEVRFVDLHEPILSSA